MRLWLPVLVAAVLSLGVAGCESKPKPEDNPRFNPASAKDPMKAFPQGSSKLDTRKPPPAVTGAGEAAPEKK